MSNEALIVEDDSVCAKLLQSALAARGYTIKIATNAEDAMSIIEDRLKRNEEGKEKWFNLICLDVHLPGTDGISMLFTLRQLEERYGYVASEVSRVIIITGDESLHTFHEATVLNVLGYLMKPIDLQKLDEILS